MGLALVELIPGSVLVFRSGSGGRGSVEGMGVVTGICWAVVEGGVDTIGAEK